MRHQVAVLSDGSVVPCCLDAEGLVALGNIFNESFKNIIESPRAQAIKTGFKTGKSSKTFAKDVATGRFM